MRYERYLIYAIIVVLGAVLSALLARVCKNSNWQKVGHRALLAVYGIGNLYFTLLSKATIPFVELESKIAARPVVLFSVQAETAAAASTATQWKRWLRRPWILPSPFMQAAG